MRTFGPTARRAMREMVALGQRSPNESEHGYVRRVYAYDAVTGAVSRRFRIGGASKPGRKMGYNSRKGYLRIAYCGKQIQLHRLIWFHQTGTWPPEQIDHINGVKNDNCWANLRLASGSQNKMNSDVRKDSATKVKGVTIDKRCPYRPFRANITANGKRLWLGWFATIEAAQSARIAVAPQLHKEFAREGVPSAVMAE